MNEDTKIIRPKAGGVSTRGGAALFKKDEDLPRLNADNVVRACEQVSSGKNAYRAVLYLTHARLGDLPTLFVASRDKDVQARWQRLWVLSPFITKMSRTHEGRTHIAAELKSDLAALNLLGKFEERRHSSVRKLFSRMHDELLDILLDALVANASDARRAVIFARLLALVDTDATTLQPALEKRVQPAVAAELLGRLTLKQAAGKLETGALRDKLKDLGAAFPGDKHE